jgi:ABC-type branched-subunit amino acid transport system permease subunit
MSLCTLGEYGGLLFLILIALLICAGLVGLLIGWVLTRYYEDVMRVEAMDGKIRRDDK